MGIHAQSVKMSWRKTEKLMDTIRHYASFPATGVSLRQMVQFGERPSVGEFLQQCRPVSRLHAREGKTAANAYTPLRRNPIPRLPVPF